MQTARSQKARSARPVKRGEQPHALEQVADPRLVMHPGIWTTRLSVSWLVLALAVPNYAFAAAKPTAEAAVAKVEQKLKKQDIARMAELIRHTPVELNAAELEHDRENNAVTAKGKVSIKQGEILDLQADRATYNLNDQTLHAEGDIRILRQGTEFKGESIQLDLSRSSGVIKKGALNLPGPGGVATAEKLELLDKDRAILTDGTLTNCDCEPPPWILEADSLELDNEANSVTARNVTLRLGGVPIAYTPWWRHPLRKERKSGFLTPSIEVSGTNGLEMDIPYYWNIAPDRDATLTLHPTSKRGVMGKVQYRYVGYEYSGTVEHHGIYDTEEDSYRSLSYLDHLHKVDDWRIHAHVETVRSDDFLGDFQQDLLDGKSRYVTSSLIADKLWKREDGHMAVEAGLRWYENQETNVDGNTIQQLPYMILSGSRYLPVWDRRLFLSGSGRFDSFYQMNGDATQRVDIAPTLRYSRTMPLGRLSLAAGVRETMYWMTGNPFSAAVGTDQYQHRESSMLSARMDFKLHRNFKQGADSRFANIRHTIEPTVQYVMNASTDQADIPNYDSRVYDTLNTSPQNIANRSFTTTNLFEENQYSGVDRISSGHWISYGLTSRFLGRTKSDGQVRELGHLTLGQRYAPQGHRDYQNGHSVSDIVMGGRLSLDDWWSLDSESRFDPHNKIVKFSDSSFTVKGDLGSLEMGYLINRNENEDEVIRDITLDGSYKLAKNWRWEQEMDYSLEKSSMRSWDTSLVYLHDCWSFELTGGYRLTSTSERHGGGFAGFVVNFNGLGGYGIK
uniref:LPS-assembly protein LptD n=1 Tax=Magnetococcus massalia (strain MO-1) TaxID=451514 RepID=A0A1S7LGX3_MAGMO|nr:putative organic solvent tolerance protein [Candidatus Magnetococcus massalia]